METFDSYVLFALIALPLAGAALLIGVPSNKVGLIRWLATLVSAVILALSLYTFALYDHEAGGFQFERAWVWLELTGWPLGGQGIVLDLAIDGLSALMVLLTGIVMFTGVLVSWNVSERSKDFFILYFVLLAGVFGVFVSLDIFFLFFFYELAVLPMYLLIAVWGSSSDFGTFQRTKEYSAMKLMMYLVAGSVLIWIAIIAIFVQADMGTFGLRALQEGGEFSPTFQRIFFPFLMVGFGILAGLWPFHTWSPDGHVAAPTSVSMVHAGVLMKLGAYGIIRLGIGLMPRRRPGVDAGSSDPRRGERHIWRTICNGPTRPEVRSGLFQRQPYGVRPHGHCDAARAWPQRRDAPDVLPWHHDGVILCANRRYLRSHPHQRHRRA